MCERQQTCPAGLSAARRVAQSPGCDLLAGGQPGKSPLGHTLQFGPAALLPLTACQHWCRCSEGMEESKNYCLLGVIPIDN